MYNLIYYQVGIWGGAGILGVWVGRFFFLSFYIFLLLGGYEVSWSPDNVLSR